MLRPDLLGLALYLATCTPDLLPRPKLLLEPALFFFKLAAVESTASSRASGGFSGGGGAAGGGLGGGGILGVDIHIINSLLVGRPRIKISYD
jgi:hypothetical protein